MNRSLPCRRLPLTAILLALTSLPAAALQVIEARDGVTVEATIALKEPTRIRIEGAPITDVFGNIYSSTCGAIPATSAGTAPAPTINPTGEIVLECDKERGEVYLRPVGAGTKPVNLFVSSANATYTLLLRRADTPADTIVLRDRSARSTRSAANSVLPNAPAGQSPTYLRSLKSFLVLMASDQAPGDVQIEEVQQVVPLWVEADFHLTRRYEGRGFIGEKYLLTNVSDQPMVLAEQEFDRENGNVLAAAIENHNLRSRESTSVYIIRRGD